MYTVHCVLGPILCAQAWLSYYSGEIRYLFSVHPLINRTLHELGLTVNDFETVGVGFNPDSLIYVRGKHMRYKNLDKIQVPYNLEEHMRTDFDQLNW